MIKIPSQSWNCRDFSGISQDKLIKSLNSRTILGFKDVQGCLPGHPVHLDDVKIIIWLRKIKCDFSRPYIYYT